MTCACAHASDATPPRCSLDEVFKCGGSKKRDFSRRGSSGNWAEDQLTWKVRRRASALGRWRGPDPLRLVRGGLQEEQSFKRRMGYLASDATPASAHGASRTTPGV